MLLLEITFSDTQMWVFSIVVIGIVLWLIRSNSKLSSEVFDLKSNSYKTSKEYKSEQATIIRNLELEHQNKIKDKEIEHQKKLTEKQERFNESWKKEASLYEQKISATKDTYTKFAEQKIEQFKKDETLKIQSAANKDALVQLQQWKLDNTTRIRLDAINMSKSVILGKVTEHLIPFMQNFPFNHKDVRFIGSPIDLIVFDGCDTDSDDVTIYIVEVKTGNSKLSKTQQKIKAAVEKKKIVWREISLNSLAKTDSANELF